MKRWGLPLEGAAGYGQHFRARDDASGGSRTDVVDFRHCRHTVLVRVQPTRSHSPRSGFKFKSEQAKAAYVIPKPPGAVCRVTQYSPLKLACICVLAR